MCHHNDASSRLCGGGVLPGQRIKRVSKVETMCLQDGQC